MSGSDSTAHWTIAVHKEVSRPISHVRLTLSVAQALLKRCFILRISLICGSSVGTDRERVCGWDRSRAGGFEAAPRFSAVPPVRRLVWGAWIDRYSLGGGLG